jgi:hypothetical protein
VARSYATPDDLAAYTGQPAPDDATALLAKAARFLDANLFRLCAYLVGDTGMPTDDLVAAAFRDAVCAQAAWWGELGDSTGAAAAGWGNVQIGSVTLGRSVTATAAEDSPARQIAAEVWDVLSSPDLTPDRLYMGMVVQR